MEIEDEINQINEIINKLDIIQEDEWQIKEGETEEEYNERIEEIEEELEEELLDYISDSLLDEQKLNEEDAEGEAEKLKLNLGDKTLNKLAKYVHKTLDLSNLDCDYDINKERCRCCKRRIKNKGEVVNG